MPTDETSLLKDVAEAVPSTPPRDNAGAPPNRRRIPFTECFLIFGCAFLFIFLLSSRYVNLYDEGIELTGAMRTMAGQVLHRDFYYIYGPAQLYILAGLFKIFGPSVLVERLAIGFSASLLATSIYAVARRFCSRATSAAAAVLSAIWVVGLILQQNLMNSTVPLLVIWGCWLIVPQDRAASQRLRTAGAGLMAGLLFLFRYDMGVGLLLANLFAAAVMLWISERRPGRALASFAKDVLWPYLAGFGVLAVPAAVLYLSVAPLHDLLYDIVLYSSKYYVIARRLPFPRPFGPKFEDLVVYLLPFLILLSLWTAARWVHAQRKPAFQVKERTPAWVGVLISLGVAAAVMYMKGSIRMSAGQVATSTMPCLVMAAILWQHRDHMNLWVRVPFALSLVLFFATALSAMRGSVLSGRHIEPVVINWMISPNRQPPAAALRSWCQFPTPITKGMCFLLDSDHIRTVEYLDAHTTPADTLYVGLAHHDRIYINDLATYFAAQRLPATKWAHFDPFLQNRVDIQREMIADLERNKPPFVVLDSEFENVSEPNGSAVSTGVHLLDDYIAAKYVPVERYGELTILKMR